MCYTKSCNKATIFVNELLLTPFSPFDIKCKKVNAKNLWKCIFKGSRRVSFSYFPKIALDYGVSPDTFQNFCGCYNIQFKLYATFKDGALCYKKKVMAGNCC